MKRLKALTRIKDWRCDEAAHVFPTDSSLEWFARQHRNELIRAGALFPRLGRSGSFVHPERMAAEVIHIITERAQRGVT